MRMCTHTLTRKGSMQTRALTHMQSECTRAHPLDAGHANAVTRTHAQHARVGVDMRTRMRSYSFRERRGAQRSNERRAYDAHTCQLLA